MEQAQKLFSGIATLLPVCTEEEKEALVDTLLKKATVDENKTVEFELYAGEEMENVVQYVKVGSPS